MGCSAIVHIGRTKGGGGPSRGLQGENPWIKEKNRQTLKPPKAGTLLGEVAGGVEEDNSSGDAQ